MAYQVEGAYAERRELSVTQVLFAQVYGWMFLGLVLTGLVAYQTAHTEALFTFVLRSYWMLALVEIGLVLWLSFAIHRLSPGMALTRSNTDSVLAGSTVIKM